MEQRPLRLGDIVDDYCPRERRVTNHAIVAIVGDSVRQTRCSTCDAEHEFKGARMPRKKAKSPAGEAAGVLVTPQAAPAPEAVVTVVEVAAAVAVKVVDVEPLAAVAAAEQEAPLADGAPEGFSLHRRLIRATLPKVEGTEPPPRPIPEFTMHQRPGRPFQGRGFRHGHGGGGGGHHANGFRPNHNNHGGNGNQFRDGEPDGNRAQPPGGGGGKPGGGGGRRRRRRRR